MMNKIKYKKIFISVKPPKSKAESENILITATAEQEDHLVWLLSHLGNNVVDNSEIENVEE